MNKQQLKQVRRDRRHRSIRKRVEGTPERPRLCVFRSLNHTYAQVIDDLAGKTLLSVSTLDSSLGVEKPSNAAAAAAVGKAIAERAKAAGIEQVVFDRSGFRYHGRVKALADAARKGGLSF